MESRNDPPEKLVSVTSLIAWMFRVLMALIIGMALFYAFTLIQSGYVNYIAILRQSAERSASEISETISNLDKQTDFLSRISGDPVIWNSSSPYEDMLYKNKLTSNLQGFLAANNGIDAAVITKRNDTAILETHTLPEPVFAELADICSGQRAITPKSMNVFRANGTDISHFIFTKAIKNGNTSHTIGNIYTLVRLDALIPESVSGEIMLLSMAGARGHNIIAGNGLSDIPLSEWETAVNRDPDRQIVMSGGTRYFLVKIPLDQPDWYILCLQPMNMFLKSMLKAFAVAVFLLAAVIALVVFGERTLIRQIRQPLSDMLADIAQIREKGYEYRLGAGKTREFREVTDNFNALLDDLNSQTDVIMNQQKKLYEVQLLQKESQLLSLQSQIKPHFLYNTLECVLSIARHYQISEIIRIVNGMILIYRYSTIGTQDGTVESEFECARMYADIINTRSKNRYQFEFRLEDRLKGCKMPKMVLQPIVENAVNHGISKRAGAGTVIIEGAEADNIVSIRVRDNGKGIPPERLKEIKDCLSGEASPEQSIGLYNICTRLKTLYGSDYGIRLESEENVYTQVTVTFPMEMEFV